MNRPELRLFAMMMAAGTAFLLILLLLFFWAAFRLQFLDTGEGHEAGAIWAFLMLFVLLEGTLYGSLRLLFARFMMPLNRLTDAVEAYDEPEKDDLSSFRAGRHHPFIQALTYGISRMQSDYDRLKSETAETVKQANEKAEREKQTLATLVSQLQSGIILCAADGRITLYNPQVSALMQSGESRARLGLGKRLDALFDAGLINYLFDECRQKPQARASAISYAANGDLIRLNMVPVGFRQTSDPSEQEIYLLIIRNIAPETRQAAGRDTLLKTLTEKARSSLANIRAASENLSSYPAMPSSMRSKLIDVVEDEAGALSGKVDEVLQEYEKTYRSSWPKQPVLLHDFIQNLTQRTENLTGIRFQKQSFPEVLIQIDAYALLLTMMTLLRRSAEYTGSRQVRSEALRREALIELRFSFELPGDKESLPDLPDWDAWLRDTPEQSGRSHPVSMKEILSRHDAEAWLKRNEERQLIELCLVVPASAAENVPLSGAETDSGKGSADGQPDTAHATGSDAPSRPVYYDFELFLQSPADPEIGQQPLRKLMFTVFDLETTGLNPSTGDEIISFGAIRILNGRVLAHDTFEALVKPSRPVGEESTRIHGITNAMLEGKPSVAEVLPSFHAFCEGSVLIGHNVAFDLRFLKLLEKSSGLQFNHPVLDTLLLSSVLFPNAASHDLGGLAGKYGVAIRGRHTALGDAQATAEIFARFIPLLEEKGHNTLKTTRELSKTSHFSQLSY